MSPYNEEGELATIPASVTTHGLLEQGDGPNPALHTVQRSRGVTHTHFTKVLLAFGFAVSMNLATAV